MAASPRRTRKPIQFTVRTLLFTITGACLLLALLHWMLPKDLSAADRLTIYALYLAMLVFGVWIFLSGRQNPWTTPTDYVTVKVDARWQRRVKSPIVMGPIAALTGVSMTFAPMGLLWCGQVEQFGLVQWIVAPLCLMTIYLVPGFYMRLAGEVIAELLRVQREGSATTEGGDSIRS
jgi:hypothetical protein